MAVVTGGASGIGLAVSERLAAEGMAVAVFDRDGEAAEHAAGKIAGGGTSALGLTVDVTDREQIEPAWLTSEAVRPGHRPGQQRGIHAVDPF